MDFNSNLADFPVLDKTKRKIPTQKPTFSSSPSVDSAMDQLLGSTAPSPASRKPNKTTTEEELRLSKISRDWEFMRTLPKDISTLAVSVDDPKTFGAATAVAAAVMMSDLNGHIRFKITRWIPRDATIAPQFVRRRHRDFIALSLRLNHCFPHQVLPTLGTTHSLASYFAGSSENEEFLTVRSRRLEAFITTMLVDFPAVCQASPDFAAFLLADSETFDEIATRYLNNKGQDAEIAPLRITDTLQTWMRTSFFNPSVSATAPIAAQMEPRMVEMCGELSAAFEALNTWLDERNVIQDRSAGIERLTSALEAHWFLLQAQHRSTRELMHMLLSDSSAFSETWKQVVAEETEFASKLAGRLGPLRNMHRLACQMSGAKDAFARNLAIMNDLSQPPERFDATRLKQLVDQFANIKHACSETGRRVAVDFAKLSHDHARQERERLEEVKRLLLSSPSW